ncbi:MAG: DUF4249 domain-containing protein [Cytophagales bacterium]|nr:MAG: DUF4249 domain-containing protein [Cytophagales bacterium]
MKHTLFLLAGLILTLTSCTKVIELDLNNAPKQVVIEGIVTDQPGPYTVRVSQSSGFYESGIGEVVPNATVTISDGVGVPESLTYAGSGNYQTRALRGVPGRTYTLNVTVGAQRFVATSVMPQPVPLDKLSTEALPIGDSKAVFAHFTDPANTKNFYRWVLTVNDRKQNDVYVMDDRLMDGRTTRQALRANNPTAQTIKSGDRVTVEMQGLDARLYDYFKGLAQVIGTEDSATPANPTSNLSGGALGYFSACSASKVQIMVP